MNERIKELAEQAGFARLNCGEFSAAESDRIERFADLVRADERKKCAELCNEQQGRYWLVYKGIGDFAKSDLKGSSYMEGMSDAANECFVMIMARNNDE